MKGLRNLGGGPEREIAPAGMYRYILYQFITVKKKMR